MRLGVLLLVCVVIWCLFGIPFPSVLNTWRIRWRIIALCLVLVILHAYPLRIAAEVTLDLAALALAVVCGIWAARRSKFWVSLSLGAAAGAVVALMMNVSTGLEAGLAYGGIAAIIGLFCWPEAAGSLFAAVSAPIFTNLFLALWEWYSIGYTVVELLPVAFFDAQIAGALLAIMLSFGFQARAKRCRLTQ